jgi:hypothetical protein
MKKSADTVRFLKDIGEGKRSARDWSCEERGEEVEERVGEPVLLGDGFVDRQFGKFDSVWRPTR